MKAQLERIIDENIQLKMILFDVVHEYGDRPTHVDGLFTSDFQPETIKRAMIAVGLEVFGEVST